MDDASNGVEDKLVQVTNRILRQKIIELFLSKLRKQMGLKQIYIQLAAISSKFLDELQSTETALY